MSKFKTRAPFNEVAFFNKINDKVDREKSRIEAILDPRTYASKQIAKISSLAEGVKLVYENVAKSLQPDVKDDNYSLETKRLAAEAARKYAKLMQSSELNPTPNVKRAYKKKKKHTK